MDLQAEASLGYNSENNGGNIRWEQWYSRVTLLGQSPYSRLAYP